MNEAKFNAEPQPLPEELLIRVEVATKSGNLRPLVTTMSSEGRSQVETYRILESVWLLWRDTARERDIEVLERAMERV